MDIDSNNQVILDIFKRLNTNEHGLSGEEAKKRLIEYGPNKLPEAEVSGILVIFLNQFRSPLIYILIAASVAVFLLGETVDAYIIFIVLIFNAIVGTIQEGKAQNTLLALNKFVETRTTVLRDNIEIIVPDSEIVPGDIVILQEGEKIPADGRVTLSQSLKADEAMLTGESEAVYKLAYLNNDTKDLDDKQNFVFKGANIVSGNGRFVVTSTGLETMIGKIAREINDVESEVPIKANIRNLSRLIIVVVSAISIVLFVIGVSGGKTYIEMFATVVTLAVSVIPEGLPIVLTLVLASGVWRMSKHNALVKKMQAVEALGQARIIAVDKTGTITKNEMVAQKVYVDGKVFDISGIGYEPKGDVSVEGVIVDGVNHPELLNIGKIASFCSNARVMFSEESKEWRVSGDPTEAAILVFSEKLGFHKDDLIRESPLVAEIPFDYKLKYRATLNQTEDGDILSVIGAPEVILKACHKIWKSDAESIISKKEMQELEDVLLVLSGQGLRVLAVAKKRSSGENIKPENIEALTFIGFICMKDALRPEVASAVEKAISAGMKVVMITGDHKVTAVAVAKEALIFRDGDDVLTGEEIDGMSELELSRKLGSVTVFARVTPEHKLLIIQAYKKRGEIIAMTGDGVNDAPSLVAADLGVAMGKIGTEVAKEAADIILLDDDFGSIIHAVEEGRGIYKTIKKVIMYLFAGSSGQVLTIVGSLVLGFPLPLLPAQIIWLNFVTDGFLDVSIAMEPKDDGLLQSDFKRPNKYIIDTFMLGRVIFMALPMMLGALFVFGIYFKSDIAKAWTMTLTLLAAFHWFNAWNCRHDIKSIFQMNPFSNKYLLGATFLVVTLQLIAIYNPIMQNILHTVPLSLYEWGILLSIAVSIVIAEEIRKLIMRF